MSPSAPGWIVCRVNGVAHTAVFRRRRPDDLLFTAWVTAVSFVVLAGKLGAGPA